MILWLFLNKNMSIDTLENLRYYPIQIMKIFLDVYILKKKEKAKKKNRN